MPDRDVAVFADTNSFLQMKDFKQIGWLTVFPGVETITVFVCNAVIAELDKHKVSTNKRRRDRARKALRLIEEAAATTEMRLTVREKAPKVDIVIWRGRPVWTDLPDLDSTNPDDYLVAAAATLPGSVVLSHDTGPRIRARIAGVQAECPPEDWLLPAEQTDDQRKIGQLTRELQEAQNARPRLRVQLPQSDPMVLSVASVPALGTRISNRLKELILEQFPKQHLVAQHNDRISIFTDPYGLGQSQIDAYEDKYDSFVLAVEAYFVSLHERVARHCLAQMPPGIVANTGNVSAKNLTLTIEADGNIELLADRDDAESVLGRISLPKPPKPPRAGPTFDHGPLMSRPHLSRTPTSFYWLKRPAIVGAQSAGFECADFRPGREEDLGVLAHAVGELPSAGRIIVSASAEHHETVSEDRAIIFESTFALWLDPLVQGLLPEIVQDAFDGLPREDLPVW
ncbi:PIN domain-containing protein [Blastomonas sp.]|uniref:PIN domain-containing protein n=1 Tax=Blastomonas sp. TaxID=1909299 RepID=UPI002617450B|nr:PIN domain-containing protein [Blastomonas sp.]MDM7957177.1 PIN domain-containing protein [Blastomonas sp.]